MALTKSFSFATLDVFTTVRYEGNPLGLVHVPEGSSLSQDEKQKIAREFNLSETVFLHGNEKDPLDRRLDIFLTTAEIPFAGHPTIGTLCYIAQQNAASIVKTASIKLHIRAGLIEASYDKATGVALASIPHNVRIHAKSLSLPSVLKSQPGLRDAGLQDVPSPVVSIVKGMTFYLISVPNVDVLERVATTSVSVDQGKQLLDKEDGWNESIAGTYYYTILDRGDAVMKVRARMIEESVGEDPATGSAASAFASYMSLQAGGEGQTRKYDIEQGLEMGRRSKILVDVTTDANGKAIEKVVLAGTAVQVMEGTIEV